MRIPDSRGPESHRPTPEIISRLADARLEGAAIKSTAPGVVTEAVRLTVRNPSGELNSQWVLDKHITADTVVPQYTLTRPSTVGSGTHSGFVWDEFSPATRIVSPSGSMKFFPDPHDRSDHTPRVADYLHHSTVYDPDAFVVADQDSRATRITTVASLLISKVIPRRREG